MNRGRTCVYCGTSKDLSCEHVVPECFSKTFEGISIARTPRGDKAIFAVQEIRDVCAQCNNGPLSLLDQYLCDMNGKYFSKLIHSGEYIRFHYDFDYLLRMLLKIGYNVARTRKWPLEKWQESGPYILKGKPLPSGIRIFLQLLIPTPAKQTSLPISPGTTKVPPLPWRSDLNNISAFPGLSFEYSMSFWAFRFFILWEESAHAPRVVRRRAMAQWLRRDDHQGASELKRDGVVKVPASSVTVLEAVRDNPTFLDQLSKARQLNAVSNSSKLKRQV